MCNSTPESTGFPTKPHCNYTAATGWTPGLSFSLFFTESKNIKTWTSAVGNEDWLSRLTEKNDIGFMETEQEDFSTETITKKERSV